MKKSFYFLATILSISTASAQQKPKHTKPNIIFILTDDLGYGDIGVFYQNKMRALHDPAQPYMQTPHLDSMASEGMILTDHYAAAPVCAPSRASILSGKNQGHAHVRDNQFDKALADDYTFATLLKEAGYTSAAIGKWGLQGKEDSTALGYRWPAHPLNRGFDYFYGYMRHVDGHEHYPKEGIYRGRKMVWENQTEVTDQLDKCYTTDLFTAVAKRWITEQSGQNKPFCIYLSYDTPHAVLEIPTSAYPSGGGLKGGIQWTGQSGHIINTATGTPDSWMHPDYKNAAYDHDRNSSTALQSWPETYQRYATSVRRIDDAVGDLLHLLRDLKIDDNTMVIFTSDNGPSMESYLPKQYVDYSPEFFKSFGPFDGIKRDVLEGGVRVPLIVRWPGTIQRGKVSSTPSISYDWLPTFLQAAALPVPAAADGVSLLPTLTGKGIQEPSNIYVEYQVTGKTPAYQTFDESNRGRVRKQMQMLRWSDTVAIRYNILSQDQDFEVFEVNQDVQQQKNLAPGQVNTALQAKLKASVLQNRVPDRTAPRPYDEAPIPAVAITPKGKGLLMRTQQEIAPWLSKFSQHSAGTIISDPAKLAKLKSGQQVQLQGYFYVPKTGLYELQVSGDRQAVVRIHQSTYISNDFRPLKEGAAAVQLHLAAGYHPVELSSGVKQGQFLVKLTLGTAQGPKKVLTLQDFCY